MTSMKPEEGHRMHLTWLLNGGPRAPDAPQRQGAVSLTSLTPWDGGLGVDLNVQVYFKGYNQNLSLEF